jgi:hypothetical protein
MTLAASISPREQGPSTSCRCYSPELCTCFERRRGSAGNAASTGQDFPNSGWRDYLECPECPTGNHSLSRHEDGRYLCHAQGCSYRKALTPSTIVEPLPPGMALVPMHLLQLLGGDTVMDIAIKQARHEGRSSRVIIPVTKVRDAMAARSRIDNVDPAEADDVHRMTALRSIDNHLGVDLHLQVRGQGGKDGTVKADWRCSQYAIIATKRAIHLMWQGISTHAQSSCDKERVGREHGAAAGAEIRRDHASQVGSVALGGILSGSQLGRDEPPMVPKSASEARLAARFEIDAAESARLSALADSIAPVHAVVHQADGSVLVSHLPMYCPWNIVDCVQRACQSVAAKFRVRAASADEDQRARMVQSAADREREQAEAAEHVAAMREASFAAMFGAP